MKSFGGFAAFCLHRPRHFQVAICLSAICSLLGYGNDERKDLLSCGGILIEQLFKAPLTSVLLYPDRTSHVLIHLSVLTISFHKYFKYLWILIISLNLCSVNVHILENDYIYTFGLSLQSSVCSCISIFQMMLIP